MSKHSHDQYSRVYLTREILEILFGLGVQPEENNQGGKRSIRTVDIISSNGHIKGVRIQMPLIDQSLVELSREDAVELGIYLSDDMPELDKTPGCTLVGPSGQVKLDYGVCLRRS